MINRTNFSRLLIISSFCIFLLISCRGSNVDSFEEDCVKSYSSANSSLNDYYIDKKNYHLDTALNEIEKVYNLCPDYKTRLTDLKFKILILLRDDQKGLVFVNSLDSATFNKAYKKKLYLTIFEAFKYEKQADTVKSKIVYEDIVKEIEKYVSNNPSDKEAFCDLLFNKIKIIGKESVLKEIDSLYANKFEPSFMEAIKETI